MEIKDFTFYWFLVQPFWGLPGATLAGIRNIWNFFLMNGDYFFLTILSWISEFSFDTISFSCAKILASFHLSLLWLVGETDWNFELLFDSENQGERIHGFFFEWRICR